MKRLLKPLLGILLIIILCSSTVSATMNVIVASDPSGEDPNGMAGGSMSFAPNMFQSTFLFSKQNSFVVCSGGLETATALLRSIVASVRVLENGGNAAAAAAAAGSYGGTRLVVGGPTIGIAIGGSYNGYVIRVKENDSISIQHITGGVVSLAPGEKGAIIHLRNTGGNPMYGTADRVRYETAVNIARMLRDGYSATYIVGQVFGEVANDSGEKYGGGAVNLISGLSTGDMFTPQGINQTGTPMDEPYSKYCPECGWTISYPSADSYGSCPSCGGKLTSYYAYEVLANAITVTGDSVSVSVYGTDRLGMSDTTSEIVKASVKKNGYDASKIADSINRAIKNGYLIGVQYVEAKDINVNKATRGIGIYYSGLENGRTSPQWELPLPSIVLDILGNIQTAIGIILILLVIFRSSLLKSFKRQYRKK